MRRSRVVALLTLLVLMAWPAGATPDVDRIAAQWYLDAIGARGLAEQGIDGRGIIVAVLDSGIDHTHPDLAGRIWTNAGEVPGNGLDDDLNGYIDDVEGWDMCHDAPARSRPVLPHGTFVAGVVAADGRTHGGVLGIAPGATVMDVQAFCDDDAFAADEGVLDPDAVREALAYAIDNGAHIIQLSMQGWPDNGPSLIDGLLQQYGGLAQEFERAHAAGIVIVGAAGNKATPGPDSPADQPHVISVGATTGCGIRHSFSNHGVTITIWAPGRALSTTLDGYGWDAGTSFAAPMVSGAVALMLQKDPALTPEGVRQRLLDAARVSQDGPVLYLAPLFGGATPSVPGPLRYAGPPTVGDVHYLQFEAAIPAPLLHVKISGGGEWCFDEATMEPLWIRPANLPRPATVSARLHTGAQAGPWLNVSFTHDPSLPDGEERPLLVAGVPEPVSGKASPGVLPALFVLGFVTVACLRRRRCA